MMQIPLWTRLRTGPCITVSHCHLFCLTPPLPPSLSLHPPGRPLPPTSSSSLLPPSLPSSSSAPHHPSPGPSPPIRECQVPLLEKNSTHSHLEPHPDDTYMLRAQPSSAGKRVLHSSTPPSFRPLCWFISVTHHRALISWSELVAAEWNASNPSLKLNVTSCSFSQFVSAFLHSSWLPFFCRPENPTKET